jgi:hypothetical protein
LAIVSIASSGRAQQVKNRFADDPGGGRANYELGWRYINSKKFDDAVAAFICRMD